ncbi:hypothetical protein EDB84DRAFT_1445593 [Lactarius hengduanensis]|nr:hypothetical protein EDB84DRAFT_1445593 [Lactarius hengduanensis]
MGHSGLTRTHTHVKPVPGVTGMGTATVYKVLLCRCCRHQLEDRCHCRCVVAAVAAVVAVVAVVAVQVVAAVVIVVVVESLGVAAAMQPSAASLSLRVLPQVVVVVGVPQALHLDLHWYGTGGWYVRLGAGKVIVVGVPPALPLATATTAARPCHRQQQDNVYDNNYKDNSDSDDMTRQYRQRRGDKSHADLADGHQPPPPPPPLLPGPCH